MFQVQALAVKDGLIYARDKNGNVSIYKESDVTPENYQKIQRYHQASSSGSPGNNAFAPHYMQVNAAGNILLTDYESRKIRVLNPALVNDDFQDGTSIDVDDQILFPVLSPKHLPYVMNVGMPQAIIMPSIYTTAGRKNG